MNRFAKWKNLTQIGLLLLCTIPLLLVTIMLAIKLELSIYFVSFSTLIYLMVLIFVSYRIKVSHNTQLQTISTLLENLIEGDHSVRARHSGNQEFQILLNLVNRLADSLQNQKKAVYESQKLLQLVMDHMDVVVLATDQQGHIVLKNQAACKLFVLNCEQTLNDIGLAELMDAKNSTSIRLDFNHMTGEFVLHRDSFINNAQQHHLFILSEVGKLLHDKETSVWQGLIRVISHELNNSLAPINTISRTIIRNYDKPDSKGNIYDGINIIKERSEHLSQFIASYSKLAQLPHAQVQAIEITSFIQNLSDLFSDIKLNTFIETDQYFFDPVQMQQVLINLIKNAKEASTIKPVEIDVRIYHTTQYAVIEISDYGTGIANPDNLFVPFYSTKKTGSGIGLVLCRQIIANHYGQLTLTNKDNGEGAIARILLPKVN